MSECSGAVCSRRPSCDFIARVGALRSPWWILGHCDLDVVERARGQTDQMGRSGRTLPDARVILDALEPEENEDEPPLSLLQPIVSDPRAILTRVSSKG